MNSIARWNPVNEFEDLLKRYSTYLGGGLPAFGAEREGRDIFNRSDWAPAVDVKETEEAFNIEAELPGLSKKDVKVTVENGVLSIQGERKHEEETGDNKHHRIERVYGSFLRRFNLPENVDEKSTKATFKDGVLTLTLQKAEPAQPKAIEVKVE